MDVNARKMESKRCRSLAKGWGPIPDPSTSAHRSYGRHRSVSSTRCAVVLASLTVTMIIYVHVGLVAVWGANVRRPPSPPSVENPAQAVFKESGRRLEGDTDGVWQLTDSETGKWEWYCRPENTRIYKSVHYCGTSTFSRNSGFLDPSQSLRQGYELAARWACNQWKPFPEYPMEVNLTLYDDEGDSEKALEALDRCIAANASVLISPYSSTLALLAAPKSDGKST